MLKERNQIPDFVISSPAVRTVETLNAVLASAGITLGPVFDESIYGAVSAELIAIVRRLPHSSQCTLLIGHNPGLEDLLSRLTGSYQHMPTAALACLEFTVDSWADIEDGNGSLKWMLTPKQIGGGKA
jgi:phosphohistidine phosphatase